MNQDPTAPKKVNPTIENALNGRYQFELKSVLSRGHQAVIRNLWPLVQACIFVFLVIAGIVALLVSTYDVQQLQNLGPVEQAVVDIGGVLLLAPLITGLAMLGVYSAQGHKVSASHVFAFVPSTFILALTYLMVSFVTQLGLMLLILPGIYFYIASSFSLLLVADKKLTAFSAIILSCRVVNKYLAHFFILFGLFFLLMTVSVITFGIGLLWFIPFYHAVIGVLYNDLFGHETVALDNVTNQSEGNFDA